MKEMDLEEKRGSREVKNNSESTMASLYQHSEWVNKIEIRNPVIQKSRNEAE